ncbi:MAG TPA: ATP-binding protein [Solirubrobacterales bacterium]|nr:ATP-binding protein [Solirubrobacterales bacterium]
MAWIKELSPRAASDGWKNDFPLAHELPDVVEIDCSRLELPIHPMFAVRLRVFTDWHQAGGRTVRIMPPADPKARKLFEAMGIDPQVDPVTEDDAILPVTRLGEFLQVEEVAGRTQEILEYQLTDVAPLGEATFMAVSELCGNAIDHGENALGAYIAVRRVKEPRKQVSIAISDLGVGIPEHIRQRYPEWSDDGWAIAYATEERVSGTGDPHRGFGFSAVFEAALTSSLSSARMDILSANGFCRTQSVQEDRKTEALPATRYRRGTWITYDLVSI